MPDIEDEEEEQQHKTGRSAFFAGVHQADNFDGSYRGVKSAPHGGAATVKADDTIGAATFCWCGEMFGHDWPGKDKGRKHPRKEAVVTTARHEEQHLSTTDLKAFDRRVAKFLADLVNDFGIRYRMTDGAHIMMYPLDKSRPKKISASRHAEESLNYLEKWVREHVAPFIVETKVEALAERFNDPTKRKHEKPAVAAVPDEPVPAPTVEPEAAPAPAPAPAVLVNDGAPAGYHQHFNHNTGEPTNWWEADGGGKWLCKSCDYLVVGESLQTKGAHQRIHSMTVDERADVSRLASAATDQEAKAKRTRARRMIRFLAEEFDVDLNTGSSSKLDKAEARAAKAEARVAQLTKDLEELKAKMALAKEAFGL